MADGGYHYAATVSGTPPDAIQCVCGQIFNGADALAQMANHQWTLVDCRPKIVVEVKSRERWNRVDPPVTDHTLPGSFTMGENRYYLFGWMDGDGPAVWEAANAILVTEQLRIGNLSEPVELVRRLEDEMPFEIEMGLGMLVRLVYLEPQATSS